MIRFSSTLVTIATLGFVAAGTTNTAIASDVNDLKDLSTVQIVAQNTSATSDVGSSPTAQPGDAEFLKSDDGRLLSNQASTPVRLGGKFPPVREIVISPNRPDVDLFPVNVEINQQIQGPSGYETKSNPAVLVIQ
ncbi:hypothetical protein Pse7367_1353 [Thalassoporum mexicanum PCC 7367]|uniref:hypothetical protein n=1 Tax=Thalassoporum mexicanum TaxID=3457544 RepID=UPI00029FEA3A|nr:hypothetical protein [Pseudanabaena sp. PCC 7367]AFY69645.1 hypothetical protein Pse7367_1353 [Pseudanabaena sp. PCC 7367]